MAVATKEASLCMKAPAGQPIGTDQGLKGQLDRIPADASLSDFVVVLESWKEKAVALSKEAEQKAPALPVGIIH